MNRVLQALVACIWFVSTPLMSQVEGDIWVMGYRSLVPDDEFGLSYWNFSSGKPVIEYDLDADVYLDATCASISTADSVLFFTNGMEVLLPNNQRIIDSIAYLDGGSYWNTNYSSTRMAAFGFPKLQSACVLPVPGSTNEYSIIYHHAIEDSVGFFFRNQSVLEARVRLDSFGYWEMAFKDKRVFEAANFLSEGTWHVCRHANGRDWWMLMHDLDGSNYYSLLIGPTGVEYYQSQTYSEKINQCRSAWFSPNGSRYAKYVRAEEGLNVLYIYDFDRCSGQLDNQIEIPLSVEYTTFDGMAFSPNSQYLFVSTNSLELYQYDLLSNEIEQSKVLVDTNDGYIEPNWFLTTFGPMMNGPDGRIYMFPTTGSSRVAHVIDRPNSRGPDAKLLQHGIMIQTSKTRTAMNFPNFRLGPIDGSSCDTLGINNNPVSWWRHEVEDEDPHEIRFTDLSYFRPEAWEWDFGDGESSNEQNPIHTYPGPGLYHACLTVSNEYNSDSSCQWIEVMTVGTEESAQDMYSVFPNPFIDYIEIQPSEGYTSLKVRLFDVNGRMIHAPEVTCPCRLKLDHLVAGVYFYQILNENAVVKSGKVVKM